MGRDTLKVIVKLEEIIRRREKETSPPWPREKWDYTEWEEALDELQEWERRNWS